MPYVRLEWYCKLCGYKTLAGKHFVNLKKHMKEVHGLDPPKPDYKFRERLKNNEAA